VEQVWAALLDANVLGSIIPGCHNLERVSPTHFRADVTLGVGPVNGLYRAEVKLSDLVDNTSARLSGSAIGALGSAHGAGLVRLEAGAAGGTLISYDYDAQIGGKAASIGGRLLDGAARVVIRQFFEALGRRVGGGSGSLWQDWMLRLRKMLGVRP
jgi:2-furoyl-CoA dehydrogenase large subunit